MNQYVKDIIKDMEENHDNWFSTSGDSIQKDNINISNYGNTRFLSVIHVEINNEDQYYNLSYIDSWFLEVAMKKWFQRCGLKNFRRK